MLLQLAEDWRAPATDHRARLDPLVDKSMHLGHCQFKDTTDREVLKIALNVKPGADSSYVWVECSGCDCGWPVPVYAAETA